MAYACLASPLKTGMCIRNAAPNGTRDDLQFIIMFPRFSTSPAHSPRTFGRLPNKEF
ncbi:hypothetical protein F5Y13DRAFT_159014 [Hypoxylon sp. FL1857]|nr:hypothetical protein F5Y13DRAFT_159014 [Hypoxylon sp. FL1857]